MKTAMVSMRIDSQTKAEAERILDNLGLNMSTVFNMMCKQVILQNGVPFAVKLPHESLGTTDVSTMSRNELRSYINNGWRGDGKEAVAVHEELKKRYGL